MKQWKAASFWVVVQYAQQQEVALQQPALLPEMSQLHHPFFAYLYSLGLFFVGWFWWRSLLDLGPAGNCLHYTAPFVADAVELHSHSTHQLDEEIILNGVNEGRGGLENTNSIDASVIKKHQGCP